MSNGNNPNEEMKTIEIVMSAEGYGVSTKKWQVPAELLRPYAIAYDAWISAGGVAISKRIYEELLGGAEFNELNIGSAMVDEATK